MAVLDERKVRVLTGEHQKVCGTLVQHRRKLLGLSQEQLADLAGVTQPTISHVELGIKAPREHVKVMLAAALSCSVGDLFPHPDRERIAILLRDVAA